MAKNNVSPPTSFKQLYQAGEIKKKDIFSIPYSKLEAEEGFNLRVEGPELDAHIEGIAETILAGGEVPPLLVRVDSDGRCLIVDGHCRHRAYGVAIERGAAIEHIDCLPYRGNDADRVARMVTSSQGRALSPIETSNGYKRLIAFNWTPEQIAKHVGKTRQHVEQLLILANSNSDVKSLVAGGKVAAAVAIKAVRSKGDKAGEYLSAESNKAAASGKKKVTAGTIQPKPIPRPVMDYAVSILDELDKSIDVQTRVYIEESAQPGKIRTVNIDGVLMGKLLGAIDAINSARKAQDEKARAKAGDAAQATINEGNAA